LDNDRTQSTGVTLRERVDICSLARSVTPAETHMSDESPPLRVLVVDDQSLVTEVSDTVLNSAHGGVETPDGVGDAFDVVLPGRLLPEVSGEDILETVHQRGGDCLVVVTTHAASGFDGADFPWVDYVVEPVGTETPEEAARRALRIAKYGNRRRELTSKQIERNVLEVESDGTDIENSTEYRRLCAEVERLEAEVTALEADLDREDIERAL
jgi:DNA-binding NtrC family response regulator